MFLDVKRKNNESAGTTFSDASASAIPKITQGTKGTVMPVATNYIVLNKTPNFILNGYRVDFDPPEDDTRTKKALVGIHRPSLGNFMFDGHMLYTAMKLPEELGYLESVSEITGSVHRVLIRWVTQVLPEEPVYLQFHNIALRSMLEKMGLEQIGHNYYDRKGAIAIPQEKLFLWKGFVTTIRNHDAGMLLCVEVTHKVLRAETALDIISKVLKEGVERHRRDCLQQDVEQALAGTVVLTRYNRRSYRIDSVDFSRTPASMFMLQDGKSVSFLEYYRTRWDIDIYSEADQPLLVCKPSKSDLNKGITGPIYLVPSLCQMTGISDSMRRNFPLMQKLAIYLHMSPVERRRVLDDFRKNFFRPEIQEELAKWNIEFSSEFVRTDARFLPREHIEMSTMTPDGIGARQWVIPDVNNDWSNHFRNAGLLQPFVLNRWVLFHPSSERGHSIWDFLQTMQKMGKKIGAKILDPLAIISYDGRNSFSVDEFMGSVHQFAQDLQMVFYILPTGISPLYAHVKRACTLKLKAVSQCMQAKNLKSKTMVSICLKIVVQICAKLRGEPWRVSIPISNAMIMGFDAYRCNNRDGDFAGALVSSLNKNCTRYYSTVSFHPNKEGLSFGLSNGVINCLSAYMTQNNGDLPTKILLFRDGVGEGQIEFIIKSEVQRLELGIKEFYKALGKTHDVKLAVVVVTKRLNTRYFLESEKNWTNPKPGTVLDKSVTLPERFEFFLVSQMVRQGTVSATNYNIVYDTTGYKPDHFQQLAFKLCHLYFNWSGTVGVPAPCHYAHKLAYITGTALQEEAPTCLSDTLWYL
ncbi:unnamed protein product [Allacma fusca]|uniref:Uncharacterized protein n=1 Tax=Allacma fusca TaxID=39272 RepID=A0A8J2PC11_9HEXA|nr:unnamed protein product [Allacma fusca]